MDEENILVLKLWKENMKITGRNFGFYRKIIRIFLIFFLIIIFHIYLCLTNLFFPPLDCPTFENQRLTLGSGLFTWVTLD